MAATYVSVSCHFNVIGGGRVTRATLYFMRLFDLEGGGNEIETLLLKIEVNFTVCIRHNFLLFLSLGNDSFSQRPSPTLP